MHVHLSINLYVIYSSLSLQSWHHILRIDLRLSGSPQLYQIRIANTPNTVRVSREQQPQWHCARRAQ